MFLCGVLSVRHTQDAHDMQLVNPVHAGSIQRVDNCHSKAPRLKRTVWQWLSASSLPETVWIPHCLDFKLAILLVLLIVLLTLSHHPSAVLGDGFTDIPLEWLDKAIIKLVISSLATRLQTPIKTRFLKLFCKWRSSVVHLNLMIQKEAAFWLTLNRF